MATGVLLQAGVSLHERRVPVESGEVVVVLVSSDQRLTDAELPLLMKQHDLVPVSPKVFRATVNRHAYNTHGMNVLVSPGKQRATLHVNKAWDLVPERRITACNRGVYDAGEQLVFQRA